MNVVINENQFDISHIYYTEPIQNIVLDNSSFVKLIYSNEYIMISGIYLLLHLKITSKENYFKKIKVTYDVTSNKELLHKLYEIENQILNKYSNSKKPRKIIYETLNGGTIKLFPNNETDSIPATNSFILKISGLWENETEYGLTYKLLCT
jgi:hypothetical protein